MKDFREYQNKSEVYWKNSSDSHLASSDFYEFKKKVLTNLLSCIPSAKFALDIGCGNGEYTALLSSKAEKTQAYDISPHLLKKAIERFGDNKNISFSCSSIEDISEGKEKYDLVFCMGVTSCLIDDDKFINTIKKINRLSDDNATIILSDSLSVSSALFFEDKSGYVAKYRDQKEYLKTIEGENMKLIYEIKLMDAFSGKVANKLFVFKKGNS